jgi:uncharacterized protein YfdQ (DUF2303 family)
MIPEILAALRLPTKKCVIPSGHSMIPDDFDADSPGRKYATLKLDTIGALTDYLNQHNESAVVFADPDKRRIQTVMNWHAADPFDAQWGDHSATYQLRHTREWRDWMGIDQKPLSQTSFIEFIEEHLENIKSPAAADVLTIATSLQGKRNTVFKSVQSLANGDRQIAWEETTEAKAGAGGETKVPSQLVIHIPVFRGSEDQTTFELTVLLRYRINDGRLTFETKILHSEKVEDKAFDNLITALEANLENVPVYIGSIEKSPRDIVAGKILKF